MNSQPQDSGPVLVALSRVIAIFTVCLMISVWPLWLSGPEDIVQIPWLAVLCHVPGWVDRIVLAGLAAGIVILLTAGRTSRWRRRGLAGYVVSLAILTALDQHRFQPWVCQFLLLGSVMWLLPGRRSEPLCRWIVISIYVWSAVSKFDASFLSSHGQLLLGGLLKPLGIEATYWEPHTRELLALGFPVGELFVAVCLLFSRTRVIGLSSSILMHLALLWTLGWGLHHEWSVLIWNIYFIFQNLVLFGPPFLHRFLFHDHEPTASNLAVSGHTRRAMMGLTALAVFYPSLELVGYCDHWPAWAVYSSRPAQVKVNIDEAAAASLPPELHKFVGAPLPLDDRVPFHLDAWSFQTCRCPIYPQSRYRLALAASLLGPFLPEKSWIVEIRLTPNRWTGERDVVRLMGMQSVKAYCEQFWANTERRLPD